MDRQYKKHPWYLLRCSCAILLLLAVLPAAAQVHSDTDKSDRLSGLASEAEQMAYCYYTTTVNTQFASLSPGKSVSGDQTATFAQWQTAYLNAAASDPALVQVTSHVTQYFNQLVSRYRQETSTDKFSAMVAIASKDRVFCQSVLEKMNRRQTESEQLAQASLVAKEKKVSPPPVNPWRKLDFSGSWQASGLRDRFGFTNRIQLVLWDSGRGLPEGLAVFINQGQRCLGAVESRGDLSMLHFLPIEGHLCRESIDDGYFQLVGKAQDATLTLAFIPGHLTPYQQKKYLKQGTLQLEKLLVTPTSLQRYEHEFGVDSLTMRERIVRREKQQKNRLNVLKMMLADGFNDRFSDVSIIGSWQGEILDKRRTYPAEMVAWSSNPQRVQQLVGLLRFDDKLCTTAFMASSVKGRVNLYINSGLSKRSVQPCKLVNGYGTVMLNDNAETMALFTTARLGVADGIGSEQCMTGLVTTETDDCFSAGLFQRKPASPEMKQAMQQFAWHIVKAPSPETLKILQNNTTELAQLQAQHLRATENNPQIYAQIKEESVQRQRRYEEAFERQKQERREESARGKNRNNKSTPSGWDRTDKGILKSPVVTGPFDDLRGASFLNALYKGDAKSVHQITRAYQEKKIRRRKEAMGNQPHIMDGILDSSDRKIRLTSVFLAVYLLNYDSVYKSCLKDDAVEFVVTRETPDTITYNMLGWETSRDFGHIDRKNYTVNKEFTDAFRRVGTMSLGSARLWNSIENMLTNNAEPDMLADIMTGTRQTMAKFKCDNAKIKQLERNILKIYFARNSP